jgi:hypothetical protein
LGTATDVDRGIVATLTDTNYCLAKQFEENAPALKEIRDLLKKERNERATHKHFAPARFPKITQV